MNCSRVSCLAFVFILPVFAAEPLREVFVAPGGDDGHAGSLDKPWRTIAHAVAEARPGTIIQMRQGIYDEDVRLDKSGTPDAPVVLENYPGERPVIDPGVCHRTPSRERCGFVSSAVTAR